MCFDIRTPQFHLGFSDGLGEKLRTFLIINEGIHGFESFKRILAIKDPWTVEVSAFGLQDAPSEATVNRRAADQYRDLMPATLEFIDDERHLLGRRHQQRG